MLLVGGVLAIFVNFFLFFVSNEWARYSGMFMAGLLAYKLILSYVFIVDFFPSSCTHIVAASQFFFDQLIGQVFPPIYFAYVSKDWHWFYIGILAMTVVAPFLMLFLPESPRFLYEEQKFDKL